MKTSDKEICLHRVRTKEHPSGSELMLADFKQPPNGFGSAKSGELLTLYKTSAIYVKENHLSSSLMVG